MRTGFRLKEGKDRKVVSYVEFRNGGMEITRKDVFGTVTKITYNFGSNQDGMGSRRQVYREGKLVP